MGNEIPGIVKSVEQIDRNGKKEEASRLTLLRITKGKAC